MYNCPHCKKSSISTISKLFTGSALTKTCSRCQRDWSVSWISMLWLLFLLIPNFFTNELSLILGGAFVSLVGIVFFTPVVKR